MTEVVLGRVLVVYDCRDTVDALCVLLRIFGYEPRAARRGREALEIVATFDPDVVLLDIALPDISGYDVARAIRATRPGAYIIAATGHAHQVDRERALLAGCDAHISKPMASTLIREVLRAAMQAHGARTALTP